MLIEGQDKIERRIFSRVDFKEPVSYLFSDFDDTLGGCLSSDISEGGFCINFSQFVRPSTDMVLKFHLSENPDVLLAKGRVTWAHRIPCSDRYQIGIKFEEISVKVREDIRQYVESHIE